MKPDAQHAIAAILPIVETFGPAMAAYWVLPNTVLTLSGARAFADGVFWDDNQTGKIPSWTHEIKESLDVLQKGTPLVTMNTSSEKSAHGEAYVGYEIITKAGLAYALANTKLISQSVTSTALAADSQQKLFDILTADVSNNKTFADMSKENINHLVFGVLLGYPDVAILSQVKDDNTDPFAPRWVSADIRGADYYDCPQPVYDYPHNLVSDNTINQHEAAWSKIIHDFYTSDFHKRLAVDKAFQAKIEELGCSNKGFE